MNHVKQNPANLFSIPPAAPFLATLVDALTSGELIAGFKPQNDPLALSGVTIYVPTRRAVRALRAEFMTRAQHPAILLPRILPLGDIEEDTLITESHADGGLDLDPVIDSLERQLLLTRMVSHWTKILGQTSTTLFEGSVIVPSSISDAAWLAGDLAKLMDSVATEEADWTKLQNLVPEDHADWWQLTLAFLQIATRSWPDILKERGAMDAAARRGLLLHRQAARYRKYGAAGPVIAAGSTGSIPATAALLKAISHLENGAVVLPGLDRDMADEVWAGIDTGRAGKKDHHARISHPQAAAPGHPQYGLKKLLESIEANRADVIHIGGVNDSSTGHARIREQIINLSMEPSGDTDNWLEIRAGFTRDMLVRAFGDVAIIEAGGERQEALAIALAMREVLEEKGRTAALITPDRVLARQVSAELKRFGVDVDDSAGLPLCDTPQGSFVKLLLAVCLAPANPVTLLSLIKHPLASFGLGRKTVSRAAPALEIGLMRGTLSKPSPGSFSAALQQAIEDMKTGGHIARAKKNLGEDDWLAAKALASALDATLSPLHELYRRNEAMSLEQMATAMIASLEAIGTDDGKYSLYEGNAGEALSAFLRDLVLHGSKVDIDVIPSQWPLLYEALLGSRPVRERHDFHPRLSIWGPLEARLQQADRIILGGLNEGTWPASTRNDPFLNRPMKSSLLLEPPERRIGLAAHDFQMFLGTRNTIITRSTKADNAPTVASRWLQRLQTLAGKEANSAMMARGQKYLDWCRNIDIQPMEFPENPQIVSQPEPKPPVAARPKKLSLTRIETWIRDPYAIYARHVLDLEPLDTILRQADARERGVLYHDILENFRKAHEGPFSKESLGQLLAIARNKFDEAKLPGDISAFWWPRFREIAGLFIDWEKSREDDVVLSHLELSAREKVGSSGFVVSCRADRIDALKDGSHVIIDYKTGTAPSARQAAILLAPQLPLEGALALKGAFKGVLAERIDDLLYVRLRVDEKLKVDAIGRSSEKPDPHEVCLKSWEALEALVAAYQNPDKGYLSRARPFKQGDYSGDYDHLARVLEWSVGNEEADTYD